MPTLTRALCVALLAVLGSTGCGGDKGPSDPDTTGTDGNGSLPDLTAPGPWTGPTGTIAYARAGELHLIEPDGSNDRTIWTVPRTDLGYTVTAPAWRPDGGEIAFSSDHEAATSVYERDLYAVRPDGSGLRKLTNAPLHAQLGAYPAGSVTVTVTNLTSDGGPYFIYVAGAPEPQSVLIPSGESKTLTFDDVADFGAVRQQAVAILGAMRWWDAAAADVGAGRTVDAGTLSITQFGGLEHYGAQSPLWRADGSRLGFFNTPTCLVGEVTATPPLSNAYDLLLDPDVFPSPCVVDRAPIASIANEMLVADDGEYSASGETSIYRTTEGSGAAGTPLVTIGDYVRVIDTRWLPDGSGFIVARTGGLLDDAINLYEYAFGSATPRQITTFTDEYVRFFSISPDGERIVFERVTSLDGPADLWVIGRDGSNPAPLVQNASYPAWNPQQR